MVQSLMVCLSIVAILLLGVVITTEIERDELVIIIPTMAQTTPTSSENMTTPMMESASFHLKASRQVIDGR